MIRLSLCFRSNSSYYLIPSLDFTGQYPHSVNGWTNGVALAGDVHTVGQRLRDIGVHTAFVGKWHLDGSDYFGQVWNPLHTEKETREYPKSVSELDI